jgi:hypothetical protein
MVGKRKQFNKTCPSAVIETYVPKNNFYRRIKQLLNLDFLYQAVAPYYGKCGQKSVANMKKETNLRRRCQVYADSSTEEVLCLAEVTSGGSELRGQYSHVCMWAKIDVMFDHQIKSINFHL